MDGNQLLMQMKHLGEVESIKDVRPLTAAMFPGTHCPLWARRWPCAAFPTQ